MTSAYGVFEHTEALVDHLPYWDFFGTFCVLQDGSFVGGMDLQAFDPEGKTDSQINRYTQGLRNFLNSLDEGVRISIHLEQSRGVDSRVLSHLVSAERTETTKWLAEARCAHLEALFFHGALVTQGLRLYVAVPLGDGNRNTGVFSSAKKFRKVTLSQHRQGRDRLFEVMGDLKSLLQGMDIETRSLSGDELRQRIYEFLNPDSRYYQGVPPVSKDDLGNQTVLDSLVASDLINSVRGIYLDEMYHRFITLKQLPEMTYAGLAARLCEFEGVFDVVLNIDVPNQKSEHASLEVRRKIAHSMSFSHNGEAHDLESEAKFQSTEELLSEILQNGQKLFYAQLTVIVRRPTLGELDSATRQVLAGFRSLNGSEGFKEGLASLPTLKSVLPGNTAQLVRKKRIKTDNLADLMPLYSPQLGNSGTDPICVFGTRSGSLFHFDPFDRRLSNFNSLITGSSGAGKSFVANLILMQYQALQPETFVIDIGGSYKKLTQVFGGTQYDLQPPDRKGLSINPFSLPKATGLPTARKLKFLTTFVSAIVCEEERPAIDKRLRAKLEALLEQLYREQRLGALSDLKCALDAAQDDDLRGLGVLLYPWTGNRPYGLLLDSGQSLSSEESFVTFDLQGLSTYPDLQRVMLLVLTDFVLGRVDGSHRRKLLVMDECWELLKSRESQNFMEYCVRTLRKHNSGITFITQGLEEISGSSIGSAILNNTATQFILPQRGDTELVARVLRLNQSEKALVNSLSQRKGHFSEAFLVHENCRKVVRILPSPLDYWLATSDPLDRDRIEERLCSGEELKEVLWALSELHPHGMKGD